ncbi:MAG TPA: ABC transporter permease [Firmicutes bacterium]|nr:ABC transporter permease [Bacillota bacterium]
MYDIIQKLIENIVNEPQRFGEAVFDHFLLLVILPVALAILFAVPLGILATRYRTLGKIAMGITNIIQTIPSLAMLVFMIVIGLGIGYKPAITALFLYSLLPILRNTYTGIKSVDPFLKEAATGMGMTNMQRLFMVELPLSFSIIMAGIRTATVTCIGTGTLAAYVGAGGLGTFIVRGMQLMREELLLIGAIPSALMALAADFLLGKIESLLVPRGVRD